MEYWERASLESRARVNASKPESIAEALASLLSDTDEDDIVDVLSDVLGMAVNEMADKGKGNVLLESIIRFGGCTDRLHCQCEQCRFNADRDARERGI